MRSASIDYVKPFQSWEVWWEALNEFFHWFFLRKGLRNNIQSHKAYWFRSNSHKITEMWRIEIKIWELQVQFVTFLEKDRINDIASVKILTASSSIAGSMKNILKLNTLLTWHQECNIKHIQWEIFSAESEYVILNLYRWCNHKKYEKAPVIGGIFRWRVT